MTDAELVAAFESADLAADQFSHAEHVRVAWWYLRHEPLQDAIDRFRTSLIRFATAKGAAGKYHETITVAYMLIIAQRLRDNGGLSWPEFAEQNGDLLARSPSILALYYSAEVLASDAARETFVMPDRAIENPSSRTELRPQFPADELLG